MGCEVEGGKQRDWAVAVSFIELQYFLPPKPPRLMEKWEELEGR